MLIPGEHAWVDFLRWAVNQDDIWAQFSSEPNKLPDQHFAYWATLTIWGTFGVPEAFLEKARELYPHLETEDD